MRRHKGLYKPLVQAVLRTEKITTAIFKKYLQCVLAARILTVDFVVCTLAVKKKSAQVSTCRIGPFPCKCKHICTSQAMSYLYCLLALQPSNVSRLASLRGEI
jgi:hypothetical protein